MKSFSIPVFALLAGAAIGYCLAPSNGGSTAPSADPKTEKGASAGKIVDTSTDEAMNAMRLRVKELEGLLAEASASADRKGDISEERIEPSGRMRSERFSPREMFEKLKKEDPERYAQMTNGMARFRRERIARAQSKIDFLASVDTSTMSREALRTHENLQNMIERREEIEARMQNPDLSDDDREVVFSEMRETDFEIRRLNAEERSNLLAQTAEALGYSGDDVEEIVTTITEIISATESGRNGPPRPSS